VGEPWGARLRTSALIGIGLLLALAATLGPPPPPTTEPGASLTVRLPPTVQTAVLALLGLSAALLLLAAQRPRRPTEEGFGPSRMPARRSAWAAIVSLLPFIVLLAAAWYVVWHRGAGEDAHPIERAINAIAGLLDLLARARKPPTSVPFFDATIAVLVLLLALGIFALLLLITLAGRLETWWGREGEVQRAAPARRAGRPGDPWAESDPRLAIVRAWEGFEYALEAARAPRAPWQTPAEFMRTTLARVRLPVSPVQRLTALFEIARFSPRPLGDDARVAACACLDEITAALDEDATRAP
jgi:hypothetical protein